MFLCSYLTGRTWCDGVARIRRISWYKGKCRVRRVITDSAFKTVYGAPTVGPGTVLGLGMYKGTKETKIMF